MVLYLHQKVDSKLNYNLHDLFARMDKKKRKNPTLRWILSTTQPLSTVTHKAYIEHHIYIIDPEFIVPGREIRMMIAQSYECNKNKLKQLLKNCPIHILNY